MKLYEKYKGLKQNLKSPLQKQREDDFLATFDDLFDLSDPNALELLKRKPVIRDFLIKQQQKGRPGTMDAILAQREKAAAQLPVPDLGISTTSSHSSFAEGEVSSLTGSISSISIDESKVDPDYEPKESSTEESPLYLRSRVKKQELISERVVAQCTRC